MDDYDDLEGVFEEDEMLLDSQESLTAAATNIVFDDRSDEMLDDLPFTPVTGQNERDIDENMPGDSDTEDPLKQPDSSPQPRTVVEQIESIFDRITGTLADQTDMLNIHLRERPKPASFRRSSPSTATSKSKLLSFPGKTAAEAWRFSIVALRFSCHIAADSI